MIILRRLWAQLRVRLIIVFTAIALITYLYSGVALYRLLFSRIPQIQQEILRDRLTAVQELLGSAAAQGRNLEETAAILDEVAFVGDFGVLVNAPDGALSQRFVPPAQQALPPDGMDDEAVVYFGPEGERFVAVRGPLTGGAGTLTVFASLAPLDAMLQEVLPRLWVALIASLMAIVGAGVFIGSNISRVLREIEEVANAIAQGEFDRRVAVESRDEVGRLAGTINKMAERLAELSDTQTQFLSKVSHELRTPLTIVKGFAITLRRSDRLDAEAHRQVNIIDQQTNHLTRLVDELLDLVRADAGRLVIQPEPVELVDLVTRAYESFEPLALEKEIDLALVHDGDAIDISLDPHRVNQVINILLDNALKYVEPGGRIELQVRRNSAYAAIVVSDDGPGIPTGSIDRIFERFNQIDSKRGGVGLGLAVAKELIEAHQGTIAATNVREGGCQFEVCLPLGPDERD